MKKKPLILILILTLGLSSLIAQTPGDGIDVNHYEIHVWDFDFTDLTMQGETFIDFTTTANTNRIVLELKSLVASDVACDYYGVESFTQEGDFLTVTFDETIAAGTNAVLDVRYGGSTFSESWGGVEWWRPNYNSDPDRVYNLGVGFESQPHNLGKTWFPCVDNFTDKATYDIFITTTNDKKAICGGNLVNTFDNGDGTTTWHWNTPQEIATYHISFAVGDYEVWEDVYHGLERDIPIEVYAKPNQMNSVPGTFVHIKEIVAFFEENLGAYPFNRIGYVSTGKGCMEHTDNIAFSSDIINGNTAGEDYVAHELSHMWSGNLVTCSGAGDMWLNEGFAQFWGTFYRVGVYGEANYQNAMSSLVNSAVSWCNRPNNWMPLNNMPLGMTYDSDAVYNRGAVIVGTMMNYMGRENFLAAMRAYFSQYAYQSATSENLRDALTHHSGLDMTHFFDTYVFGSGMPHLFASITGIRPVGNQYEVTMDLRYQHIGDTHIGQANVYEVTFIGPGFEQHTERLCWDGLHGAATVTLDFEPVALVGDLDNGWLDGKLQKRQMMKNTAGITVGNLTIKPESLADSVFVSIEEHLIGPYDDPLVEGLTLSSQHFWTVARHDFGEAAVRGSFFYDRVADGDIIHTQNDSAVLLYRRNASEAWHEIESVYEEGSLWRVGIIHVADLPSGDYTIAVWNKEILGMGEWVGEDGGMRVFPNPAENLVNVSWEGKEDGQIVVSDMSGRVLKRFPVKDADSLQFSTDSLAKGSYHLSRTDSNGVVLEVKKIVIK